MHNEIACDEFEKKAEVGVRREEVEKFLVAIEKLVRPFELNKKQRAIIDYDPQKPMVSFQFFIAKE